MDNKDSQKKKRKKAAGGGDAGAEKEHKRPWQEVYATVEEMRDTFDTLFWRILLRTAHACAVRAKILIINPSLCHGEFTVYSLEFTV